MSRIEVSVEKCTGCRVCELICSFQKNREFNPRKSGIRVRRRKKKGVMMDLPIVCRLCAKPVCVESCTEHAMEKQDDGTIRIDEDLCVGCGKCFEACPFDAIQMDPITAKPVLCDLCDGDALCAEWCMTGALIYSNGSGNPRLHDSFI